MTSQLTSIAAGVPWIAIPPKNAEPSTAPAVIAWHLHAPPMTPRAFAAAIPLEALDAWRIYLAVPMSPTRPPEGGMDVMRQLVTEDVVRRQMVPVIEQGAGEFANVFAELRSELGLVSNRIGLMGGSIGSAIAARVALDTAASAGVEIAALVLISAVTRLSDAADYVARAYGFDYPWDDDSRERVQPNDLVARAAEFDHLPVQVIVGDKDDANAFMTPAQELIAAVPTGELVVINGMPHALVDDAGIEPSPQNQHARQVDAIAAEWFRKHL